EVAVELDADHPAAARHLAPAEGVLRMARETGIVDAPHSRCALKAPGQLGRRLPVALHADRQRLDAAQHQVAVHRTRHGAARVRPLSAPSRCAGSRRSTKLASMPSGRRTFSKSRYVPPYTSSPQTTWSPGRSVWRRVVAAAHPLAKAKPLAPPSRAAMHASSAARVGLPLRE